MELSLPIETEYVPVTTESQDRPFLSRDVYFKKGCDAIRLGGPARNHNQACRDRMKRTFEQSDEGRE
eukprot:3416375-Karenia_brevis.AAC.1